MRIKKGYVLKPVGDTAVVVAVGKEAENFKGIITLNETALGLWNALQSGADIEGMKKALTDVYDVSDEKATDSAQKFVAKLIEAGVVEE